MKDHFKLFNKYNDYKYYQQGKGENNKQQSFKFTISPF